MTDPKLNRVTRQKRKCRPIPPERKFPRKRDSSPPPLHPGSFGDSNPSLTKKELGENAREDYPILSPWRIPPNNRP